MYVTLFGAGAATGTSAPVDCSGNPWLTAYLKGVGADVLSAGVVTLEEADYQGDDVPAGAWSAIGTINAADASAGGQKALHLTVGAYSLVRARITTPVVGGTVQVALVGVGSH